MAALAVNKAGPEGGRGPGSGGGRGPAGAAVKVRRRLGSAPVVGDAGEEGVREACGTGWVPWGAGLMDRFGVFFLSI